MTEINQDTLRTLDSAIDDLNRLYFASFDLTQDERQRFNDSIKKLEDLKQEIKLHLSAKNRGLLRGGRRRKRPTDTNEQKPQILKQNKLFKHDNT